MRCEKFIISYAVGRASIHASSFDGRCSFSWLLAGSQRYAFHSANLLNECEM